MKVCFVCGNQVNEQDKFCSQCGTKLIFDEQVREKIDQETLIVKIKICDLCGEENDLDAVECKHCGVGFTGKEKVIEREIKSQKIPTKETTIKQQSSTKKEKQTQKKTKSVKEISQGQTKKLQLNQLILIGLVIALIGSILIYYGIENSKISSSKFQSGQNNSQTEDQRGIDLNAINEINRLEAELKNNPDDPDKLLRLAHLTHDSGFFEKAISYYEKYLSFRPDDNDAEVDLGVCYFELKQYDKASSIFETVIHKNPKHQIAYLNLGIVNLTQGKVVEAKEFFQKCIALGEHTDAGHRAAELLKS
ncbi:MAG: tetratricopeptide repeat protein, partial [Minisyncoccia bacterium]